MARSPRLWERTREERVEDVTYFYNLSSKERQGRMNQAQANLTQANRLRESPSLLSPSSKNVERGTRNSMEAIDDIIMAMSAHDTLAKAHKQGDKGAVQVEITRLVERQAQWVKEREAREGKPPAAVAAIGEKVPELTTIARENLQAQKDEMIRMSGGVPSTGQAVRLDKAKMITYLKEEVANFEANLANRNLPLSEDRRLIDKTRMNEAALILAEVQVGKFDVKPAPKKKGGKKR